MSLWKLAFQNFRKQFKNYLALILSQAFSISILLNFQYLRFSDSLAVLGEQNQNQLDVLVNVISVILICFMFFFVWYSTNVFLKKRKKEIGIFVFMGLTNQKIGQLYMIECFITGILTTGIGIVFGIMTTQLFQMILLRLSDISIELNFQFIPKPILLTLLIYLVIYLFFILSGYISIVRSNVLDLVNTNRKNEFVKQNSFSLISKTILGIVLLGVGFYFATKDGGIEVISNLLLAVILVVFGTYFILGGLVPLIFQKLAKQKLFLYKNQRVLWINNMIFRMQRNYRTYAIVSVLMLSAVTALATGFSMKTRYDNIMHFRNTYTYQVFSVRSDLEDEIDSLIEKDNDIVVKSTTPLLFLSDNKGVLSYSNLKALAKESRQEFSLKEPKDKEVIAVSQLHLLSLITDLSDIKVEINDESYTQIDETSIPYMGYLQEITEFFMVNDQDYQKLLDQGQQYYTYNYRISDIYNFAASNDELESIISDQEDTFTGRVTIDPDNKETEWVKILYSLCIFMFIVFIQASGSVLFMKNYEDGLEERERYGVLKKMGINGKALRLSIAKEQTFTYLFPFILMSFSSYFSIHALEKLMYANLLPVNIVSVLIILGFLLFCYIVSVFSYFKTVDV
ncbi:putative ABC transport system permease protein [Aequitasia blattaphilus]|uniref:ABC transporter permease n=1 Tax=Aequitasia blattaphilus TaxID=2949332 RepID=A0ABT1E7Y8_9FIRM|nr:ABC transporter permease [Aequitasia blattaphilus]MCP1101739.1 ABC transporter permease [Aequitasia blattaphilus]MCR8614379.1 ABC transporter permease [Aequitasia blattaphilus]